MDHKNQKVIAQRLKNGDTAFQETAAARCWWSLILPTQDLGPNQPSLIIASLTLASADLWTTSKNVAALQMHHLTLWLDLLILGHIDLLATNEQKKGFSNQGLDSSSVYSQLDHWFEAITSLNLCIIVPGHISTRLIHELTCGLSSTGFLTFLTTS